MTPQERDLIESPANGLIIYNTTINASENNTGTKQNRYGFHWQLQVLMD
jgi:hypothetical protein